MLPNSWRSCEASSVGLVPENRTIPVQVQERLAEWSLSCEALHIAGSMHAEKALLVKAARSIAQAGFWIAQDLQSLTRVQYIGLRFRHTHYIPIQHGSSTAVFHCQSPHTWSCASSKGRQRCRDRYVWEQEPGLPSVELNNPIASHFLDNLQWQPSALRSRKHSKVPCHSY